MSESAQVGNTLNKIRSELLDQLLLLYAVFGLLVFLVAYQLITKHGWTVFAFVQAFVAFLLMGLAGFRKRLSVEFKGHALAICFTTLAVNSMITTGLLGRGTLLLILACVIACFALSLRQGQVSAALGVSLVLILGGLESMGFSATSTTADIELLNQTNWVNTAVFYAFIAASLLIMLSRFQQHIETLLESQQRNAIHLAGAREEAERANAAKTEFLSRMSHELRTPLNAILGFTELMQLEKRYEDDNRLDSIRIGGEHLLVLINEVLDLMGIEEGHLTLVDQEVDLGPIFDECNLLNSARAQSQKVSLDSALADGPILLRGDALRIKQVLLNLISNGVKYNQSGGSVTLRARKLDSQWAEIAVADTGIGIAKDDFDNVFEPFTRFGSMKTDVDGTGVGLTISRQLVELMGGELAFTSEVGVGTTFTFRLPLAT